jgi:hypothetical protein
MYHYRVIWEIDICAANPQEAAKQAREMQIAAGSTATVFDVIDEDGEKTQVDLLEQEEQENSAKLAVGDRITFKARCRYKTVPTTRSITGFTSTGEPYVRFNGWSNFIVQHEEIIKVVKK